ncbi:dihydrodipicolinate synthase family protein [Streptomyces sp. SudanB182_2057]|uniref:dihydrodipicolinate synthase family protein n=1 Tax=Streptomyces sp. SudanB182_2057 TaxID=3035281 RepID=UPI003F55CAB1
MPVSDQKTRNVARLRELTGVIVPLVTPVDDNGKVDEASVARLLDTLHGSVDGFMPALSSGEGWKLSLTQWMDMVRYTVRHARGLPVLAGAELGFAPLIAGRSELAASLGADAIVVPPPFSKTESNQLGFVEHVHAVERDSDLPIFLYCENEVSGWSLDAAELAQVCALPSVIGVKESSADEDFTRRLLACDPGVPVFQGWEHLITKVTKTAGFIGSLANLEPEACRAALAHPDGVRQARVDELSRRYKLDTEDWYVHIKKELAARGVIGTGLPVD